MKLSLFTDDMIVYIENPKESPKIFLELIKDYSKVAGDKVNMQQSTALLYINNEQLIFEIKTTISFILAAPKIKYIGINLTKYIQDLHKNNCKTMIKKIKDLNKWRESTFTDRKTHYR